MSRVWLWKEETPTLEMLLSGNLDLRHGSGSATFTRDAPDASYIDSVDGLLKFATTNTPRYELMLDGIVGLLVEGAASNICLQSESLNTALWFKRGAVNVAVSAVVSPDGVSTMELVSGLAAVGVDDIYQAIGPIGSLIEYNNSIWMQQATSNTGVITITNRGGNHSFGAIQIDVSLLSATKPERMTYDHQAVTVVNPFTGGASGTDYIWIHSDGVATDAYMWGGQSTLGYRESSYIPTTTVAVPRANEACFIDNANIPTLTSGCTMVCKSSVPDDGDFHSIFRLNEVGKYLWLRRGASGVLDGIIGGVSITTTYTPDELVHAYAIRTDGTTHELLVDGDVKGSSTGTLSQPTVDLYLGSVSGSSEFLNSHIRALYIYPRKLSDTELLRMVGTSTAPVIPDGASVNLIPEWDLKQEGQKVEDVHRVRSGRQYRYKWGDYDRAKFSLTDVNSADTSFVNSWWNTNTQLLFTQDSGSNVSSVYITNGKLPLGAYMPPYDDLFSGKLELETY